MLSISRCVVAIFALVATIFFVERSEPPPEVPPPPPLVARADPPRSDSGWRIEVDGVVIDPPDLSAPAELPREEGLRLERLALFADSIGRHSADAGMDWRLISALIAEESAFDPSAISSVGAFGLMQVRETAAREVGVVPYEAPDDNIRAGVRYLAQMRDEFRAPERYDRIALMLAAYNMGPGHLRDAQKVAVDFGFPANKWEGAMRSAVLLLEQPAIHRGVRHGYAQGRNVVAYVERVLKRYASYRRQFPSVMMPSVAMIAEMASQ